MALDCAIKRHQIKGLAKMGMERALPEWPETFPQNVPPAGSVPANGQSYRLVNNNPPEKSDFDSSKKEGLQLRPPIDDLKYACWFGTSQYRLLNDIKKTRRLFPKLRNKLIALGELEPSHGNMLDTFKDSHHTVWYRTAAQPHEKFNVLEGV